MKTYIETIYDVPGAAEVVKMIDEKHALLNEVRMHVFRGSPLWVLIGGDGKILSLLVMHFGKQKRGIWGPYVNGLVAYTPVPLRRRGYATVLCKERERVAKELGCRRLKSLACTEAGLMLHYSLGHQMWGLSEGDEVVINTPLVELDPAWMGKAPHGAASEQPTTMEQIRKLLDGRPLKYERGLK